MPSLRGWCFGEIKTAAAKKRTLSRKVMVAGCILQHTHTQLALARHCDRSHYDGWRRRGGSYPIGAEESRLEQLLLARVQAVELIVHHGGRH